MLGAMSSSGFRATVESSTCEPMEREPRMSFDRGLAECDARVREHNGGLLQDMYESHHLRPWPAAGINEW